MDIRNVLVPVDFSTASRVAVEVAVPLARKFRAQLTLLHIVQTTEGLTLPVEPDKAGKQEAETKLNQFSELLSPEAPDDPNLNVRTRIRTGSIEDEILAAVDEAHAGIVVMGTHDHGLARRLLMGSVSQDMVRRMPVPLLTISGTARPKSMTRILFATDLTESSQDAFRFALKLARTLGADMILHHAIEPIPMGFGGFNPVLDDPTDRKILMEQARAKLSELEAEGRRRQVVVVSEVTEGVAAETILTAAEDSGSGLIVLTVHYKGLLERALLGFTAERIVRESRVPVLSIPLNDVSHRIEDRLHPRAPAPDPSAMP